VKRVTAAVVAALLFAGFFLLRFPTEALVRRAVERPGWPAVEFASARLRPGGIRVDDVTVRAGDGSLLVRADTVHVSPSLAGLLDGSGGYPWTVESALCGGTSRATIAAEGTVTAVALTWEGADLALCPPLAIAGGALAGRARGAARLRLGPDAPAEGDGRIDLEAAMWRGTGLLAGFGALRAEAAAVRWRLGDGVLELQGIELAGPDVSATGSGEVRFAAPVAESDLTLRLAVAPVPGSSGLARLLPRGDLLVAGTLASPRVVVQSR
jgi:type II secretion system protein N